MFIKYLMLPLMFIIFYKNFLIILSLNNLILSLIKKFFIFFNLFSKLFIISNLLLFSILSIFLSDFFMIWFFMEINNFMFISLLCLKIYNKKIIFFYYIIQTMASLLIMFSIIYSTLFFSQLNLWNLIFILALMIKLGIPPFHLWMVSTSLYLDWNTLFLFLSIQKIIPMYMLSLLEMNMLILYLLILSSSYLSTFKMMMNLNFKIILSYSSINQMSWMLLLIMFKNIFWFMYFIIYTFILFMINLLFQFLNLSHNFFYNFPSTINLQLIYMFLFFNMASLPPMSFFFMKWFSVFMIIFNSSNMMFLIFIMLMNSFILIYIYINMMTMLMFFYSMKSKLLYMTSPSSYSLKKFYFIMFFSLFFSLMMIMI